MSRHNTPLPRNLTVVTGSTHCVFRRCRSDRRHVPKGLEPSGGCSRRTVFGPCCFLDLSVKKHFGQGSNLCSPPAESPAFAAGDRGGNSGAGHRPEAGWRVDLAGRREWQSFCRQGDSAHRRQATTAAPGEPCDRQPSDANQGGNCLRPTRLIAA